MFAFVCLPMFLFAAGFLLGWVCKHRSVTQDISDSRLRVQFHREEANNAARELKKLSASIGDSELQRAEEIARAGTHLADAMEILTRMQPHEEKTRPETERAGTDAETCDREDGNKKFGTFETEFIDSDRIEVD